MDRQFLIRTLCNVISEVSDSSETRIKAQVKNNKIIFRAYQFYPEEATIDIQVEMKKKKTGSALTKARSQLKKAEGAHTPESIKKKLKPKREKKS